MAQALVVFLLGGMLFLAVVFSLFFVFLLKHFKKRSKALRERLHGHEEKVKSFSRAVSGLESLLERKVSRKACDELVEKMYGTALGRRQSVQAMAVVRRHGR